MPSDLTREDLERLLACASGFTIQKREGYLCAIPNGMANEVEPNCNVYERQVVQLIRDTPALIALVERLAEHAADHHPAWCICGPGRKDDPKCPAVKARALLPEGGQDAE